MTDVLREIKIMLLVCDYLQTMTSVQNIPMWEQYDVNNSKKYHKYLIKGNDNKYPFELCRYCDDECKLKNVPSIYYGSYEQIACVIEYCNNIYMSTTQHNTNINNDHTHTKYTTNKRKR